MAEQGEGAGPRGRYAQLTGAVRQVLVERGVLTDAGIARAEEVLLGRSPAIGARVVARAWTDAAFAARLRADARAACRELGIELGPVEVAVVENAEGLHNLVVCTLCSCYPRSLLGVPPDWYKDAAYRSRAVREPRAVLAELGTVLGEDVEVRVHDSTADLRYLVVPRRPEGSAGLDEPALAALVTRDAMIGVAVLPPVGPAG